MCRSGLLQPRHRSCEVLCNAALEAARFYSGVDPFSFFVFGHLNGFI